MIVVYLGIVLKLVKKHKRKTQMVLLALATLFLIPNTYHINFMWQETLYSQTYHRPLVENYEEKLKNKETFENTILIVCDDVDFIRYRLGSLECVTKQIEIVQKDVNKNTNYFVKIFLHKADKTQFLTHPLNFAPNSELYTLSRRMFGAKIDFTGWRCWDTFRLKNQRWINEIHLNFNPAQINDFIWYIRHINNLYSHYYGIYFYMPFREKAIKCDVFSLFTITMIIINLFNLDLNSLSAFKIFSVFIGYKVNPLFAIFCINNKAFSLYAFIFLVIDAKIALLYSFIGYLGALKNLYYNK